ncbi:hypothetical protein P8X24_10065 [Pyrococcus kukulkanii]|uniref:hypothetical protein n=1 Tax=Pyrococcus kukulkanii TaxID=1609559 RepID=UPI00356324A8
MKPPHLIGFDNLSEALLQEFKERFRSINLNYCIPALKGEAFKEKGTGMTYGSHAVYVRRQVITRMLEESSKLVLKELNSFLAKRCG